jgi:hypothetical protein
VFVASPVRLSLTSEYGWYWRLQSCIEELLSNTAGGII